MDNHPIPQDVTGFQFKLIGNMTIKQFAYVACGVILAVILYYLPLGGFFGILTKFVFIPLCGGSGFLIAFLPIEGRPVDVMVGNFMKALVAPNQYIYQKQGAILSFATVPLSHTTTNQAATRLLTSQKTREKSQRLQMLLQDTHMKSNTKLDEKEAAFLASLSPATPALSPIQLSQPVVEQEKMPQPQIALQPTVIQQQEQTLEIELEKARRDEAAQSSPANHSAAHQKVTLLERQIQSLHAQREQLEQELTQLQTQLQAQSPQTPISTQSPAQPAAMQHTTQPPIPEGLKTPPQQPVTRPDLPHVSDTPNVVVGIVKDPRGNVLPNMLVEVKDKEGNPVRAFKTNALGQFASATPLTPGSYTIELEDPKRIHQFSAIQLELTNQILMPIEVISHDAREELRKQLFN